MNERQVKYRLSQGSVKMIPNPSKIKFHKKEYNEAYNFKISEQSIWLKLKNIEDDIFKIKKNKKYLKNYY